MIKRHLIGIAVMLVGAAWGNPTPGGLVLTELTVPTDSIEKEEKSDYRYCDCFRHGNPTWRCQIENTSDLPRTARLTLKSNLPNLNRSRNSLQITSAYMLGAKETKIVEMRLPFIAGHHQQFAIVVDDGTYPVNWGFEFGIKMDICYNPWNDSKDPLPRFLTEYYRPLIVLSEEVLRNDALVAYAYAWTEEYRKAHHLEEISKNTSPDLDVRTCDVSRFKEWRDFSVVSAVVIGPKTWAKLNDDTRMALKGYVVAGGSVVLVGENFPKDALSAGTHGLGEVAHLKSLNLKSQEESLRFAELIANGARNLQFVRDPKEVRFPCGDASMAAVEAEIGRTPFGTIILVLASFILFAGPALVIYLARTNRRIHLLWIFPSIAVVFTAIVIIVLIAREGTSPRIKHFVHTAKDAEWGVSVTVEDTVIVAPIPVDHAIDLPADALISFDGGDRRVNGEVVAIDDKEYHFLGTGWTPSLWPVRFRSVRVEGGVK